MRVCVPTVNGLPSTHSFLHTHIRVRVHRMQGPQLAEVASAFLAEVASTNTRGRLCAVCAVPCEVWCAVSHGVLQWVQCHSSKIRTENLVSFEILAKFLLGKQESSDLFLIEAPFVLSLSFVVLTVQGPRWWCAVSRSQTWSPLRRLGMASMPCGCTTSSQQKRSKGLGKRLDLKGASNTLLLALAAVCLCLLSHLALPPSWHSRDLHHFLTARFCSVESPNLWGLRS